MAHRERQLRHRQQPAELATSTILNRADRKQRDQNSRTTSNHGACLPNFRFYQLHWHNFIERINARMPSAVRELSWTQLPAVWLRAFVILAEPVLLVAEWRS